MKNKPNIHSRYIDTVSQKDIDLGQVADKVVKTTSQGFIPDGVISPEQRTRIRTLNGAEGDVEIKGEGLARVDRHDQEIVVTMLAPTFFPLVTTGVLTGNTKTVTIPDPVDWQNIKQIVFSTTVKAHIFAFITAKVTSTNPYSARINLDGNSYSINNVSSDILYMSHIFINHPYGKDWSIYFDIKTDTPDSSVTVSDLSFSVMSLPSLED